MATGLLVLVVGRATRLARYVPAAPKRYRGTIRLGVATDTDDSTGRALARHAGPLPDVAAVRRVASTFVGRTTQRPPQVSAVSVGGQRLYRLARRGLVVSPPPRPVEVMRFDLAPAKTAGDWEFEAEVSSGTYIRSLARDLGEVLGCGGSLESLRRVGIGSLNVDQALTLSPDDAEAAAEASARIIPLDAVPLTCPDRFLGPADLPKFVRGIPVTAGTGSSSDGAEWAARSPDGALLGIGVESGGLLRPRVVLAPEERDRGLPEKIGV
jgi:tRNA pseudouridine(55) synthase